MNKIHYDVFAMAVPLEKHREMDYYHGTDNRASAEGILQKGIQPQDIELGKEDFLTPVEGKVYLTPNLDYALIYVVGADMVGVTLPGSWIEKERYGYVFVIDGRELMDIQPDEDSIGEMLFDQKGPSWLDNKAREVLTPNQYQKVMDGEYIWWANAGKKMLKVLYDWEKLELIDYGAHVAHTGPLQIKECWRLDKTKNPLLKKDGSNFFEIAERIK